MPDLGGLQVSEIVCINLRHRKDRKVKMTRQGRKKKFPFNFFTSVLNKEDPVRGCLTSHRQVLVNSKKSRHQNVLILEDDIKVISPRLYIPPPPQNWDVLYLGGVIEQVFQKEEENNMSQLWQRVLCKTAIAYVVKKEMYDIILEGLKTWEGTLDDFYFEKIQPNYKCYMLVNPIVRHMNGYSDVLKKEMNYDNTLSDTQMNDIPKELDSVECEYVEKKDSRDRSYQECVLKTSDVSEEDLPGVTIITPTYNRPEIFPLAVRNFYKTDYPGNKLEWVIIDDGDEDKIVSEMVPPDERIKYIRCDTKKGKNLTVTHKRNIGVTHATNRYIVHMDDDDYYYPTSVLSRVKVLLANPEKDCVGCTKIAALDLVNDNSVHLVNNDVKGNLTNLFEKTMAYRKEFWTNREFNENLRIGNGFHFINGRYDKIISMPYSFVLLSLYHNKNLTTDLYKLDKQSKSKSLNFMDALDYETKEFLNLIKETLET